jgi:hypothetical protein
MSEAQNTQISDNVNQGYIAGRDLYLGDQYVVQETLFFEPDLKDVEPPGWTTTPKAEGLAHALMTDHLIVLAGQGLDDKTMVARHLAWLLRQQLPGEIRVREWYRSSDPQKIETAFHETATTILLLPQVQPHHIGHRLYELHRLLQSRLNYAVITTDCTRAEWGIRSGSPEESAWHEVSWETYYGRPFLTETLLLELTRIRGRLPDWLPRDLHTGSLLVEGLTLEETAARLRQPDRIRQLCLWLRTEEATPRALLEQLDQLGGDRTAIFHWYRQLERTDQLFALGLVLFDGLPDDQIFAAVEYLVDEAWRRTDPNLPLFDYRDLDRLSAFFHLTKAGDDGERIEVPSRQKRGAILRAAWELQRRRLLAVVPAMTRLIKQLSPPAPRPAETTESKKESPASWRSQLAEVGPPSKTTPKDKRTGKSEKKAAEAKEDADSWRFTQGPDRELFSSPRRIEQLQRSVIESLSQIGLLSFEAVEASFLELAVDGSVEVQTVVAKALAAWRGEGHHEELFRVLRAWWEAGCRTTLPKALEKRKAEGANLLAAIRATVALAIGYALQYDPPDRLAPELLGLVEVVVKDGHPAVRQRVLELTLPLAAASHPQQLEALLRDRVGQDQEQMYAIAFGVAMAFTLHPFGTLRVIAGWRLMVRGAGPKEPGDRTITPRDRLLSAVALAYGYIRCDQGQDLLTTQHVVAELRSIFTTENHPFVRTHALIATGLQALHDFEPVAPMLMELISEITLADRINVVSVFVRAYLKQRGQLSGGDGELEVGGKTYQIWTRSPRPLTPIETSLYSWLRDEDHPVARQVAALTFAAFAATELERKERDFGAEQEPSPGPNAPTVFRVAPNPRRLRRLPFFGHLAVFFAAPLQKSARRLIRPVMAEMIDIERDPQRGSLEAALAAASRGSAPSPDNRLSPAGTPFVWTVFDRWRANDDQEVQGLASSARKAFDLFRWRWVFVLTAVFCSVLVMNWMDWRWSQRNPWSLEETLAIQQRGDAPLRFARNKWLSVFRELRAAELEKAAAEAALAEQESAIAAALMEEPETKPRRIPNGPMEQLLWSAELALQRMSTSELLEFLHQLQLPEEAVQRIMGVGPSATLRKVAAVRSPEPRQEPAPASRSLPPKAAGEILKARQPQRSRQPEVAGYSREEQPSPQVSPEERELLTSPETAPSFQERGDQIREELEQLPTEVPVEDPSFWKKLRKRIQKKPPTGEGHGNG